MNSVSIDVEPSSQDESAGAERGRTQQAFHLATRSTRFASKPKKRLAGEVALNATPGGDSQG
jgi:hypothetical protein